MFAAGQLHCNSSLADCLKYINLKRQSQAALRRRQLRARRQLDFGKYFLCGKCQRLML
ncbi:MAG: hypothetical protein IJU91_03465 [Selenomonadaceae bacterium]|nr:hypothetical protein [Selenomonadaceae bacterium]